MDILMGIVIAFIIGIAAWVGFYAAQEPVESGGHDISIDLEVQNTESMKLYKQEISKYTS